MRALKARLPLRVVGVYVALLLLFVSLSSLQRPRFQSGNELVHLPSLGEVGKVVDAVVFISMGDMARDSLIDYAVATVRNAGKWKGAIYVLTDAPACFSRATVDYDVKIITVPTKSTLMQIKALKPQLLDLVPSHVQSLLYLDVDIVVARELDYFLSMVGREVLVHGRPRTAPGVGAGAKAATAAAARAAAAAAGSAAPSNTSSAIEPPPEPLVFDFAAFGDAKGHYVGFCAGCEKWHTGVMILRRGQGKRCLQAWADVLASGRFKTDQESLDQAERSGACPQTHMLPSQYMLFAKDYIAALLTTGHTFIHATSVGRRGEQDGFYRGWVVPRLRSALGDRVDPTIIDRRKSC